MNPPIRRVVITEIGLVTPVGIGTERAWDNLVNGVSGVTQLQACDRSRLPVTIAAQVTGFDPANWMPFKQTHRLDRNCHFALAAAELAVPAAVLRHLDGDRTAVVVSGGFGGTIATEETVRQSAERPDRISPFAIPKMVTNMAAGCIAERFGMRGPSLSPISACASSADAIGMGFRLIRDGYADACVAGGTEAPIVPSIIAGFAAARTLSRFAGEPAWAARPFDAERDGFVLAEGAAILLLETASSACERGAHVYAEISGYGQTNDAYHMTAPDPAGQTAARAISAALHEAGLTPADISYVNAHGTGTVPSDPAETRAIKLAFGDHASKLAVSSTKSMTGHLLSASGALEAAICALAIDRQEIPPTINLRTPDPVCDLDYVPGKARAQPVHAAVSNSMGFGGHNVALALRRFTPGPA